MSPEPYVLVVDDNPTICHLHAEALREASLEVTEAKDGVAALDIIRARPPLVIVTDGNMPRLDGMALIRWVRSNAKTRDIPIVMVSADNSEDFAAAALSAGCDAMLSKPCSAEALQSVVQEIRLRRHAA